MKTKRSTQWTGILLGGLLSYLGCASAPEQQPAPPVRKVRKVKKAKKTKEVPLAKVPKKEEVSLPKKKEKKNLLDIQATSKEAEEKAKEYALSWKARQALSEWYFKEGKKLYDAFRFEEAEKKFETAFELYPKNVEAQRYLLLTRYLLEKGYPSYKLTAEKLRQEKEVMIQEKRAKLERLFDRAVRLYSEAQYEEAAKFFREVVEMIRGFPYHIDDKNYLSKAQQYLKNARQKAREQKIREMEKKQELALQRAREEELRMREAKNRKIQKLLKRAMRFIQLRRYDKAIQILKEVLEEDPDNPTARPLLQLAKEGKSLQFRAKVWKDTQEYLRQDRENINAVAVPYADYLRFPSKKEWQRISARGEGIQKSAYEEPEWVKEYKAKLKQRIIPAISFRDKSLEDVVKVLQRYSGLTIVIDPQLDTTDKQVSLRLRNVSMENILNILMDKLELTYVFKDEAIFITEKGKAATTFIFEILNIQDILTKIKDFPGPKIQIRSSASRSGAGVGGGINVGAGMGGGDDEEEGGEEALTWDKLEELIKSSTGEENWQDDTNQWMDYHRGQLLINNTPEVIMKVKKILKQLRKNKDIFVVVEARFIEIQDDYLRDIGIDYRGLGLSGIGMSLNLIRNSSGGVDAGFQRKATTGTPSENTAGRIQNIFDGFAGTISGRRLGGGGGLTIQSTWIDPFQVNAILHAALEKQNVLLLTAPIVTAHDRERVNVSMLTQRAYIADYDLGSAGTQFSAIEVPDPQIDTFQEGVVLDVQPIVSYDRKYITLNMRPTLATLVGGVIKTVYVNLGTTNMAATNVPIGTPEIQLLEAHTSVTIPDGGTALLGGFRVIQERSFESSLPFVANIPILNIFFRRRGYVRETESIIILVSAKIMDIRSEEAKLFNRK